jgi:hypothetical protein
MKAPQNYESLANEIGRRGVRNCGLCVSADVDEAALTGAGELSFFLLPGQFAARSVDEMKPAAGLADHGVAGRGRIFRLRIVQPMLHVQAGVWTFENDITQKSAISDGFRRLPC